MKRAFTLIELLVVIAIIALLSTVILATLNSARAKGYDAKRVSDLRQIQKALELYWSDNNGSYPSTGGSWRSECSTAGAYAPQYIAYDGTLGKGIVPNNMSQFPADPQMNVSGTCCYYYVSDGTDYAVMDYNCSTSNAPAKYPSLKDPNFTTMISVYSAGAAAKGW